MLYYYEKRNIDTVDEVVDNLKTISTTYSFYSNKVNGTSPNTPYPVASYSKRGYYYTDRKAFINEMGTEFLVYNGRIVQDPHAGQGFSYKIKKTVHASWDVGGILYKATIAKGDLIELVISEEGMYPDDGVQGDYWYVKKGRAINFKYKDINGIVYDIAEAKYKDVNGNIVDIASAIYKDGSGNILS